jgi:uncharacterized protein YjiK
MSFRCLIDKKIIGFKPFHSPGVKLKKIRPMKSIFSLVVLAGVITFSTGFVILPERTINKQSLSLPYSLNQPDDVHILPAQLMEVSGLTDLSATEIACVQDEKGVIFTYDLVSKTTGPEITFAAEGDYEGLTRVDDILFALSSEGVLHEIKQARGKLKTEIYPLPLTSPDNEGLCYDEKENRLLIAPKSKLGKGPEYKDARAIFVFDLHKREMEKEPLFYYNVSDIYAYAELHDLPVHTSYKKNGTASKHPNFRPSSLSIHPHTQEIYVVSAEDLCLVVFDKKGTVTGFSSLDPKIFSKPEGITFFPDGTMVITNEGVTGAPTAIVFHPKE